jgi:hypothetical protein
MNQSEAARQAGEGWIMTSSIRERFEFDGVARGNLRETLEWSMLGQESNGTILGRWH